MATTNDTTGDARGGETAYRITVETSNSCEIYGTTADEYELLGGGDGGGVTVMFYTDGVETYRVSIPDGRVWTLEVTE